MIAVLTGLLSGVGGYLVAGIGIIAAAVAAWFTATKGGERKQQVADAQRQQQQVKDASNAEAQGNRLDDSTIQRELHTGYDRK